ncbi:pentapeptide repeat-containing protein [Methylocapsa polymorpha]|uniref:Pentapeptide repeat-containing protein n=1 Tax=Methylocapsa polymorpha TaxID=3080828 RepID=A0ABZ0HVZ1_9HYPH|nr:pentapeptide repeat-containing protein [Methylocapsa sp. RX1]
MGKVDETTPTKDAPAEKQVNEHVKAFFLDLAAKGRESWNGWRRDPANKDVRVTFAQIDFSREPWDRIDFSGFEFGDEADFSDCEWRGIKRQVQEDFVAFRAGRASFEGAIFDSKANFNGAVFSDFATFEGASFGDFAMFSGAAFGCAADFNDTTFSGGAIFEGAAFEMGASFEDATFAIAYFSFVTFGLFTNFTGAQFILASFDCATFGAMAVFDGATFADLADFDGATFGGGMSLDDTIFKRGATFKGVSTEQWNKKLEDNDDMDDKEARVALKRRHDIAWAEFLSGPDRFQGISFANARFDEEADFSGRSFEQTASFIQARFYRPPLFYAAINVARIDFTGTHIGFVQPNNLLAWTKDSTVPIRLRQLRKIVEESKEPRSRT